MNGAALWTCSAQPAVTMPMARRTVVVGALLLIAAVIMLWPRSTRAPIVLTGARPEPHRGPGRSEALSDAEAEAVAQEAAEAAADAAEEAEAEEEEAAVNAAAEAEDAAAEDADAVADYLGEDELGPGGWDAGGKEAKVDTGEPIAPAALFLASDFRVPLGQRFDSVDAQMAQVKGVPDCLKRAIVIMCTHAWVPVEDCLKNPTIVRALVPQRVSRDVTAFRKEARQAGAKAKINVGGASRVIPGWVLSDIQQFDVTDVGHYVKAFGGNGFAAMRSEHMFEHLFPVQTEIAAAMSYLFMAPGGHFRIAVPDGYHPDPFFIHHVEAGNRHQHKMLWTVDNMPPLFLKAGYDVQMREYFDRDGDFHKHRVEDEEADMAKWSKVWRVADEGLVRDKLYGYTSLYFDAIKPADCPVWQIKTKKKKK